MALAGRHIHQAALAAIMSLGSLITLSAQTTTGSITGRIADSSQAAMSGVELTAVSADTGLERRSSTNQEGLYTFALLPPGAYQVTVQARGFRSTTRSAQLLVSQTIRLDFTLELGTVAEAVEVSAVVNQIQTENSKVVSAVTNKMVDELPLVVGGAMRSPFDLALITPEANRAEGVGESDTALSIGGGQSAAYGATLDGVTVLTTSSNRIGGSALNTPSVDAITEFAVESNGFKAEFGRGQGGTITFSSKSGTNELHGTAYEFLRNNAFDARRFFEASRGVYKQHDFGWSVGGPVYIPKIYNGRSRTFLFASAEWFRNRVGAASQRLTVPTGEMYGGDFSRWVDAQGRVLPIYDPATTRPNPAGAGSIRTPFAGNLIPANRFANFSKGVLSVINLRPNVNATPGTGDYVRDNFIASTGTQREPARKYSIKVDHNFSANDRASFLYNFGREDVLPGPDGFPGLPGVATSQRSSLSESPVYRASYTKVISSSVVNYAYGGNNGYRTGLRSPNHVGGWKAKGICINGVQDCDATFPQIAFSDYTQWGGNGITGSRHSVYSFGDDLTITRGRHTLKAGYLYDRLHYYGGPADAPANRAIAGWLTFDRRSTSVPNNNTLATGGGNSFASFLLGDVFSGLIESDQNNALQWPSHSWYFQDDWRISQRLTLNLGVRYELTQAVVDRADQISDFTPNRPNPRAGNLPGALRFAGDGPGREGTRSLVNGWYGGIGPRFGLAYALGGKTVLRAAIGRSFGVAKTNTGTSHFDGFRLVANLSSLDNGVTRVFAADTGFPSYPKPPVIDPSYANGLNIPYWEDTPVRPPENYQWTFSLQRQISAATVLEASYNATIGAHLLSYVKNPNQVPFEAYQRYGRALLSSTVDSPAAVAAGIRRPYPGIDADYGGRPVSVAQALRPYPQYQAIQTGSGQGDKSGHSSYHAMVFKLDRRFAQGVSFQGSYVLSKILTDADRFDGGNAALDHNNRGLEKSIGTFDQTHNLKLSYIFDLPMGKGKKWLARGPVSAIVGNWRIAGIQYYSSGYPINLTNSINYLIFNGRAAAQVTTYDGWVAKHDNPNWTGSDRFFQPASFFGPQSTDRLGNATRHNPKARTPWGLTENFSLAKSIPITKEDVRLDLRIEMFNAFNRSRFSTGPTNVESLTFGRVTSTVNAPRRMQVGLKLYW